MCILLEKQVITVFEYIAEWMLIVKGHHGVFIDFWPDGNYL